MPCDQLINKIIENELAEKNLHSKELHPDKIFAGFVLFKLKPFWDEVNYKFMDGSLSKKICYKLYKNNLSHRNNKLITIVQGRGESMFKYAETCFHFYHLGFDILLYDHRGQGFSDRLLKDSQKGYVDKFSYYVADLDLLLKHIQAENYTQRFIIAHSLGGLIVQNYLANYPHNIAKLCLISPFFGLNFNFKHTIYLLVKFIDFIGLGKKYAFGKGKYKKEQLINNIHNSNKNNIKWENKINRLNPKIKMGGPTFHWLHEALKELKNLDKNLAKINIPSLILLAEKEQVVSLDLQLHHAQQIKNSQINILAKAHHEILSEHSRIKYNALNKIAYFLDPDGDGLYREDSSKQ